MRVKGCGEYAGPGEAVADGGLGISKCGMEGFLLFLDFPPRLPRWWIDDCAGSSFVLRSISVSIAAVCDVPIAGCSFSMPVMLYSTILSVG